MNIFSRWPEPCSSLTNLFLLVAILVLAVSILTGSNSIVASVGILAATANYIHRRHIAHESDAIAEAKGQILNSVDDMVSKAINSLATWREQVDAKVKEAIQTSEVAAKLRVGRTAGGLR